MVQKIWRVGNSLVVTIPKEEAERLGLHANDLVNVSLEKMELRPALTPQEEAIAEQAMQKFAADLDYLKDR
jgi:antitoxin component of MazEF toxin-antitoxin module